MNEGTASDDHRAGYVVAFLHSPSGLLLVTASPAIGLAALFVLGMRQGREAEESAEA